MINASAELCVVDIVNNEALLLASSDTAAELQLSIFLLAARHINESYYVQQVPLLLTRLDNLVRAISPTQ